MTMGGYGKMTGDKETGSVGGVGYNSNDGLKKVKTAQAEEENGASP